MEDNLITNTIFDYLPLTLQDLCLIQIINDLDTYPVEWLALLPLRIRSRLLNNLPVYDLCLLDGTTVSEKIDVKEIFRTRINYRGRYEMPNQANYFMTRNPSTVQSSFGKATRYPLTDLDPELLVAFSSDQDVKQTVLYGVLWDILFHLSRPDIFHYAFGLMSVQGPLFLADTVQLPMNLNTNETLPDTKFDYLRREHHNCYQLWSHSASGLSVFKSGVRSIYTQVMPRHLLPFCQEADPLKVLNFIVLKGGLHPVNMCLDVEIFHEAYYTLKKRYSISENIEHLQFFKALFSKIIVLALKDVSHIKHLDTLKDIMETVFGNGVHCTLKSLEIVGKKSMLPIDDMSLPWPPQGMHLPFLCPYTLLLPCDTPSSPCYTQLCVLDLGCAVDLSSLPYLNALLEQQIALKHIRLGLVDSCQAQICTEDEKKLYQLLFTLYDRENFQTLRIHFECRQTYRRIGYYHKLHSYHLFPIGMLLQHFLQSQCVSVKRLFLEQMKSFSPEHLTPLSLTEVNELIPERGTNHKNLTYDKNDFKLVVSHLLQLPVIRLQELVFNLTQDTQPLFSQAVNHPNLKVGKLCVNFVNDTSHIESQSTIRTDVAVLFQIPTLNEISFCGDWMCYSEVKSALVAGLQRQSRICSLRKIHLDGQYNQTEGYTESEFQELWEAIFSFPLADQLEVKLGIPLSVDLVQVVLKCWMNSAPKKKLKVLQLKSISSSQEVELTLLRKVTQEMTMYS